MAKVIGYKTYHHHSFVGALQMAVIKVRYCFYTKTYGQGHRSKHATITAPWARYKLRWLMFAIVSTPEHMARVIGQTRHHHSSLGAVQRAMIKVRYCFYTRTHGQGHKSNHATTTASWARYKGRWLKFAIDSTPEHMVTVISQNTLLPQLRRRGTKGDD